MMLAASTANSNSKPWVLDPVGAGATTYRTSTARDLAGLKPTVIRGNASEIMALAGEAASAKGVDAGDAVSAAEAAARSLATQAIVMPLLVPSTSSSRPMAAAPKSPTAIRSCRASLHLAAP
jgi:hydroxyethylthiazole kinase-like sugar kinase family protein